MLCEVVDWSEDWATPQTPLGKRPVGMEINPSFCRRAILYVHSDKIKGIYIIPLDT